MSGLSPRSAKPLPERGRQFESDHRLKCLTNKKKMDKPDLRVLGHQVLDDKKNEVTSLVLITTIKDEGVQMMIGGYTKEIVRSIAATMQANPELRRYFEEAWAEATKAGIMN